MKIQSGVLFPVAILAGLAAAGGCGGNVVSGGSGGSAGTPTGSGGYGTGGYGTGGYGTGGYGTGGYGTGGYGTGGYGTGGYGTGGYGTGGYGTGGYGGSDALGKSCTTNADCGVGLTCVTASSTALAGDGVANGYCTRTCAQASDCTAISPGAQCVPFGAQSFCLQGCDPAASYSCRDRADALCRSTNIDGSGPIACYPQCVSSADCNGRTCDVRTGLCTDQPSTGDPVGADCNPNAGTNTCAGFCVAFQGYGGGMCTELCNSNSLGQPGACGSDPTPGSPQQAACIYQASAGNGGNVGICGQLCNCDADCRATGDVCESWAAAGVSNASQFLQAFKEAGLCVPGTDPDGGTVPGIASCPGDTG